MSETDTLKVYGLSHPDGRWFYRLPNLPRDFAWDKTVKAIEADGAPMAQHESKKGWWITDHKAERIAIVFSKRPRTARWELVDETAQSVRYPAELSPQEFQDHPDYDSHDEVLYRLYRSVNEVQPDETYTYEGPYIVLEGREPPGPDEPAWHPDVLNDLSNTWEYQHLFPGRITGMRDILMNRFKDMPHVEHVFANFQHKPGVYVSMRLPYEEPVTEWKPDRSRRTGKPLKTGKRVPVRVARSMRLPIQDAVHGDNYAHALAQWNELLEYWTGQVRDAAALACNHCGGEGFIVPAAQQHPH